MFRSITIMFTLCLATSTAQAALVGRSALTEGGTDYRAYYDDDLNITWVADANLAVTTGYDVDGLLNWGYAQLWIGQLNTTSYLGVSDWRLPTTSQPDATCSAQISLGFPYPLQGGGYSCTGSEMGHLFYAELGGEAGVSIATTHNANFDLFTNFQPDGPLNDNDYWSDTTFVVSNDRAWYFRFSNGFQNFGLKFEVEQHAWAVRSGDIADVDSDGLVNGVDNCALVANPTQLDVDADGYGNLCDGDINNSGTVTTADFGLLRSVLGQAAGFSATAAAADMNGSGTVTTADFGLLRARLGTAPGPSGLACAGTISCPGP